MADNNKFVPFVPADTNMPEFTMRALFIGLFLALVLGAANAYLGLKAGMTIAATYPAAVIGMAILKAVKGSILEENFTRTVGSIGESIAAGAIFTLPAFYIAGIWEEFFTLEHYIIASLIMITGGVLGIMFVALLRRVMVEDKDLPFPESIAAAEIHKTGRSSSGASKYLFGAMGLGALIKTLGELKLFQFTWEKFVNFGSHSIGLGSGAKTSVDGGILLSSPGMKPAYIGVGYIIGPKLASLNFSGGVLAWGLLTPIILYFIAPHINFDALISGLMTEHSDLTQEAASSLAWQELAIGVWKSIVRPIAIGGMLVGTAFTLWNMRKSLFAGIARSINDVKKAATGESTTERTDKDIPFNWIVVGILAAAVSTFLITFFIFNTAVHIALVATVVMIIAGFFFGAVSGYLVGIIGSSNNPISGLTISTVVLTALLMLILGATGQDGIAATLGVAAIVCVSAAVAGEMLQDLKAGHILGGTPWKMQIGDIIGVVLASVVMFIPIFVLHEGDIKTGGQGFGGSALPAPQAALMAILSTGIIGGEMAWPLIIVGMLMGVGFILMQVKSPMLVSIGMYLPMETTFAIFVGGLIKGILDRVKSKINPTAEQDAKIENTGVLLASGLIAGEALMGLFFAAMAFMYDGPLFAFFQEPSFITSLFIFLLLGWLLVKLPMNSLKSMNSK
jgi:putative OPT family oligopeptide transporter